MKKRSGGQILIDQLENHGVGHIFTVPGESFLAALDALYEAPSIRIVVCRHESGASMMAEAMGKLTGKPGVAIVTRAPGAANAVAGVHIAAEDETPLLLLVGLPPRGHDGRGAFQDLDLAGLFGSMTKRVDVVRDARRLPELVARAMHLAVSGRPGPVVLGLPEDVLAELVDTADVAPAAPALCAPAAEQITRLGELLAAAERPLVIVGGPGWTDGGRVGLQRFLERFDLPAAASFRCQDFISNNHPCFVGHAGIAIDQRLAAGIRGADLIIAIGAPLGEIATAGYSLIEAPNPRQALVHVRPDAATLNRVHRATLAIAASSEPFVDMLAALDQAPRPARWAAFRRDLRRSYEMWREPVAGAGPISLADCVRIASEVLPEDAIVTNGAGNYTAFLHRHFTYKAFRTALAPVSGTMGYGLPAAIAAKLAFPKRAVVAFAGDGCFMMTAMEMATAVQCALPLVIIVADNGMYGTIRMHQERKYPGRVIGTSLVNPDFVTFARSFGAYAEAVRSTDTFGAALSRALSAGRPALIALALDPQMITPDKTLDTIRTSAAKS